MKPMETDAIISVAPCRECLDIYNDLKQVNKTKPLHVWHISSRLTQSLISVLSENQPLDTVIIFLFFIKEICVIFMKHFLS